jgi:hypothetical protein
MAHLTVNIGRASHPDGHTSWMLNCASDRMVAWPS